MGGKSKRFLKEEAVPTVLLLNPQEKVKNLQLVVLKNVPESCVLKKLLPAMQPVQAMSVRKTCKSLNLLQKSALVRSL